MPEYLKQKKKKKKKKKKNMWVILMGTLIRFHSKISKISVLSG